MQYAKAAVAIGLCVVLAGCEESNTYVAPPPPKVTVAEPLIRDVMDYLEFTGTTESTGEVEVRARRPGILQEMQFQPGSLVNRGELLFTIDPLEYETAVDVALADLARAEALRVEARKTLERARALIQRGNISQASLDEAEAEDKAAEADVLAAKANLRQADIDLSYTYVTAPITGRVGRNLVDVGNLVGENEATVLTDITSFDPMYAYFSINERDLLRILERAREKGIDLTEEIDLGPEIVVELGLANEVGYPHRGMLDFSESAVDPTTGTIEVRGLFPNGERPPRLLPGMFARVRMSIGERANMPLVSERAIGADQQGTFLLVVNGENVVEKRPVELGQLIDGMRVIETGIGTGEHVIVNGLQRARPGAQVDPAKIEMGTLATSARLAPTDDTSANTAR